MKKLYKILSVLLALQLLCSSAALGVFALDEAAEPEQPAVTETADEAADASDTEEAAPAEEAFAEETAAEDTEVVALDSEEAKGASAPAAPNVTLSGNTATVTWTAAGVTDVRINGNKYHVESGATSYIAENLEYGAKYTFTVVDSDGDESAPTTVTVPLAVPAGFTVTPSHQSVTLTWAAVAGADAYNVYRNNVFYRTVNTTTFVDEGAAKDTWYTYKVQAAADSGAVSGFTANLKSARVRNAYYKCTFKAAVKLKSHDKAKKAVTFRKGQVVYAEGYGTGAYKFTYNGRPYEAKWFRMSKVKVQYKKNYYNARTAEAYINQGGYSSATPYLIWISSYSQRVFVMQGSRGNWHCIYSLPCNTGAGKSPTPTGFSKKIHQKYTKHSKHKYWSCFSSVNAIHGRNKRDAKPGKPVSNGCVRIANANAKWIMNKCPLKTKVISF